MSAAEWSQYTQYILNDLVQYGGILYRSLIVPNTNNVPPSSPLAWVAIGDVAGVANPMVANLDGGGFNITNVGTLTANTINYTTLNPAVASPKCSYVQLTGSAGGSLPTLNAGQSGYRTLGLGSAVASDFAGGVSGNGTWVVCMNWEFELTGNTNTGSIDLAVSDGTGTYPLQQSITFPATTTAVSRNVCVGSIALPVNAILAVCPNFDFTSRLVITNNTTDTLSELSFNVYNYAQYFGAGVV